MLLLSNVVQNAVIGNDTSVAGGLLGATVLVAINALTVRVVNRSPRLITLFEGADTVVVDDGHALKRVIRRLGLRVGDVAAAVRRQGANDVSEVRRAVLSPGGALVVELKDDAQDVTRGDLREYHERLRELLRADVRAEIRGALADAGPLRTGDPKAGEPPKP